MALLPIITAPDTRLREVSQPVDAVDETIRKLLDDMLDTMYAAPGVGLSAIQVGVAQRIIVIDTAKDPDPPQPVRMINPEIIWRADEIGPFEEGCLSFPQIFAEVTRPERCKVEAYTPAGERFETEYDGFTSRILQHEYDHLEGVLLVDRMSAADKQLNKAALQELVEEFRASRSA